MLPALNYRNPKKCQAAPEWLLEINDAQEVLIFSDSDGSYQEVNLSEISSDPK